MRQAGLRVAADVVRHAPGKELDSSVVLTHWRLLWLATLKLALDFFRVKNTDVVANSGSSVPIRRSCNTD